MMNTDRPEVSSRRWQRRSMMPIVMSVRAIALIPVLALGWASCAAWWHPFFVTNVHLTLGNPSHARTDLNLPDNYLILRSQYALSYNNSTHIPNWVSWQLNRSWLGEVARSEDFRPDTSLPPGWLQIESRDYIGSGLDRGHMAPAGDRSNTPTDNSATFLMTNILPQAPDNNRGPWEQLESYCRDLVRQGKELYITSGSYGVKRHISRRNIVVPTHLWKVIVVMDTPGQKANAITANNRVIAVIMPNEQGIKETPWRTYRVTIQQIEQKTGYSFLDNAPDAVKPTLKTRLDQQ